MDNYGISYGFWNQDQSGAELHADQATELESTRRCWRPFGQVGYDWSQLLLTSLTWAALLDWCFGRILLRLAAFLPESPTLDLALQSMGFVGEFIFSLVCVLASVTLGTLAWEVWHKGTCSLLPVTVAWLLGLNLSLAWIPFASGLLLCHQLATLTVLLCLGWRLRASSLDLAGRLAAGCLLLTLLCGSVHQLAPVLYATLGWVGPVPFAATLFYFGEALLLPTALGLWWVEGRGASAWLYLVGALPALVFGMLRVFEPSLTGMLAIWVVGVTLFLPWFCYALMFWLVNVAWLRAWSGRRGAAWAIPLLLTGGYAPQLSVHTFLGLVALWQLVRSWEEAAGEPPLDALPRPQA